MAITNESRDAGTGIRTVTVDNEDGTGTRTTYNADGSVASGPTVVTGLYVEPQTVRNERTILQAADNALATNAAYVGLATPTAAQQAAQIKALTRQMNGLIRLAIGRLEATG